MTVSSAILSLAKRDALLNDPQATLIIRLLEEHDLNPLEKHSENLSRFLGFIGKPSPARHKPKW